jgi:dihydroxyacetone kinase
MSGAARSVLSSLDSLPLASPPALAGRVGELLSLVMGGSSGVLLSIFFTAVGQRLAAGAKLADAMEHGAERVQVYGGARQGHRTMLDALLPAIGALKQGGGWAGAAAAASAGAQATMSMKVARAGRSSYVPSAQLEGTCDPGAVAVALFFESVARHTRAEGAI